MKVCLVAATYFLTYLTPPVVSFVLLIGCLGIVVNLFKENLKKIMVNEISS